MIELPPNARSNSVHSSQEVNHETSKGNQINQPIRAVVIQSNPLPNSNQAEPDIHQVLIRLHAASSQTGTPVYSSAPLTEFMPGTIVKTITPEALQAMQQGKFVQLHTQSLHPLMPGSTLVGTITHHHRIVIQKVLTASITQQQNALFQAIKQLAPNQQGYANLMSNLTLLLTSPNATTVATIPKEIQDIVKQFLSILPNMDSSSRQTNSITRHSILNSGIFLENKLGQIALNESSSKKTVNNPSSSMESKHKISGPNGNPQDTQSKPLPSIQVKNILSEGLKLLSQRLSGATQQNHNIQKNESSDKNQLDRTSKKPAIQSDLKQTLFQLKQQLESHRSIQNKPTIDVNHPLPNTNLDASLTKSKQQTSHQTDISSKPASIPASSESIPKLRSDISESEQKSILLSKPQSTLKKPTENTASIYSKNLNKTVNIGAKLHPHNQSQPPSSSTASFSAQDNLLPPLPGQIFIQPQSRTPTTLKGDELADALVSILLKQVKGTLARITLHQLASQSASKDPGAPPQLLSFEIPILQSNQASVFQFRIEEEPVPDNQIDNKQHAKRWLVQMGFDIEGLGPMLCQIALSGHNTSVTFWAEWENTLQQTKAHFDYLEAVLIEMGLNVKTLQGHLGIPETDKTLLYNQLVDIKT